MTTISPRRWTAADDAALVDLAVTCTAKQMAAYLDRSEQSVKNRLRQLPQSVKDRRSALNGQHRIPWKLPRNAIVVALTCSKCGKLRDAKYFRRRANKQGGVHTWCQLCFRKNLGNRNSENHNRNILQDITFPLATKRGQPYTQDELEQIMDPNRSEFELALTLERTYEGIYGQRKLGDFPTRPRRPALRDSYWRIHFPHALQRLQDHFKELREPIPDVLWELDERELANQDHRPARRGAAA